MCKAMGARRIIAVDVSEGRLEFAKRYAATDIHLASPLNEGEDRATYSQRHVSCGLYFASELVVADGIRRRLSLRNLG